jgi:hypothetical protein
MWVFVGEGPGLGGYLEFSKNLRFWRIFGVEAPSAWILWLLEIFENLWVYIYIRDDN